MEFQYALRFESGERRGEVVPISIVAAQGGTFTIGRKPGNSLQVTDPSVSGRHAELEIGTDAVKTSSISVARFRRPLGRPFGLPDWPGL